MLNVYMAWLAQRNEIGKLVSLLVGLVFARDISKAAERNDMMNVQLIAEALLTNATMLAFVVIALPCLASLTVPVWAIVGKATALPVPMLRAFVPGVVAILRTKPCSSRIRANPLVFLVALLTDSPYPRSAFLFSGASRRTQAPFAMWLRLINLFAYFAGARLSFPMRGAFAFQVFCLPGIMALSGAKQASPPFQEQATALYRLLAIGAFGPDFSAFPMRSFLPFAPFPPVPMTLEIAKMPFVFETVLMSF